MMFPLFLAQLSCDSVAPLTERAPVPQEAVNLISVSVPVDCPHLIVDMVMSDQADITVACFSRGVQTHYSREERPLSCEPDSQSTQEWLTLQYADDPSAHLFSVP